jgi:hypothetical protein
MMGPAPPIELPRPNLGPDPWPDAPIWPWLLVAAGFLAPLLAVVVVKLKARRKPAIKASQHLETTSPVPDLPSREALVRAFGPSLRARTTEEVAASSSLAERFGDEVMQRVVAYLRAVDRAKFSGDASAPDDELGWWATRFVEEVDAGGGNSTNSRILT